MSAPSDEPMQVWHFDGVTGIRRMPVLEPRGESFVLVEDGQESAPYRFADLIWLGVFDGHAQYGLKKRPGWKVGLIETTPAEIAAQLPGARRYGRLIDRIGLWPAVAGFAIVSAGIVALILVSPAILAQLVPRSVEARVGDLMVGDFGKSACTDPAGEQALAVLAQRLGTAPDIDVQVIDVPMVNAVTLPGGHVAIFRGLLDRAQSSDEVAGVLAHELGHVAHRDVMESLLRQFGLSVVLGGLDGNVGGYTNALLSAGYSRGAEGRADGYAIDALARAHISPQPTAAFFKRLSQGEVQIKGAGTVLGYLSTHPMSADREARFAASAGKQAYTPALTDQEWQALRGICQGHPEGWQSQFGI